MSLTIAEARIFGLNSLKRAQIASPNLDVDLLLAAILKLDKLQLIVNASNELSKSQVAVFKRAIRLRAGHVPIPYLTKRAWFFGREFSINKHVLVPRPETEDLVKLARDYCLARGYQGEIIEPCTGSGAIGITLALETGNLVKTSDISKGALHVARYNAARFGARLDVKQCDFLNDSLVESAGGLAGKVLVMNPPYIREDFDYSHPDSLPLKHEPPRALFVDDGLTFYRRLRYLISQQEPKAAFCEINEEHGQELIELFDGCGLERQIIKDSFGRDRIFFVQFS